MSVVKPNVKDNGFVIHVNNCMECDFYIPASNICKKTGKNITKSNHYCSDGIKTIKARGKAK